MGKTLKGLKKRVKLVSSNEKKNRQIYELIQLENDCFGMDYSEEYEQCRTCNILSEFEDRRGPLYEFCKEFTLKGGEELSEKEESEPAQEEHEEQDGKTKTKKEKSMKEEKVVKGVPKSAVPKFLNKSKELIAEGKNDEEVLAALTGIFKGNVKRAEKYLKWGKV